VLAVVLAWGSARNQQFPYLSNKINGYARKKEKNARYKEYFFPQKAKSGLS